MPRARLITPASPRTSPTPIRASCAAIIISARRTRCAGHYVYVARDYPSYDLNPNFYFSGTFPNDSFAAQEVHTFNPGLLNEFRVGWQRGSVAVLSPREGTNFRVSDLGINGMNVGGPDGGPLTASESGFPVIGISGYLGMGDDQASSNLDNSQTSTNWWTT